MKSTPAVCCLAALLALSACAPRPAPMTAAITTPTPAPVLTATPTAVAEAFFTAAPSVRARQYGEETALVADENGLTGTLRYPQGELVPVNEGVRALAYGTLADCEERAAAEQADINGMRASVSVDYDAYVCGERFIGVKLTGEYRACTTDACEPILCAFNYDLSAGREPMVFDVIRADAADAVTELLQGRLALLTGDRSEALDRAALTRFVVRGDGVEWLLTGADGAVGVLLENETLAPYLCRRSDVPAPEPAGDEPASDAPAPTVTDEAICLYDGVQLRSLPSMAEGDALGTVAINAVLPVVKANAQKGWHAVLYEGRTAYVYARLVQLTGGGPAFTTGWVTSRYLHVRERADTTSALLGTMAYQQRVRVADTQSVDGWYKIWFEGRLAYVRAANVFVGAYPIDTLDAGGEAAPPIAEETDKPRLLRDTDVPFAAVGICLADGLIVRDEPDGAICGSLRRGDQVYILHADAAQTGWDRIFAHTDGNIGYIGYVRSEYVETTGAQ